MEKVNRMTQAQEKPPLVVHHQPQLALRSATDMIKLLAVWVGAIAFLITSTIAAVGWITDFAGERFYSRIEAAKLEQSVTNIDKQMDRFEKKQDQFDMKQDRMIELLHERNQ